MGVVVAELDPRVREDPDAGRKEQAVVVIVLIRVDAIHEGTGGGVVVRREEGWPAGGLVVIGGTHPELVQPAEGDPRAGAVLPVLTPKRGPELGHELETRVRAPIVREPYVEPVHPIVVPESRSERGVRNPLRIAYHPGNQSRVHLHGILLGPRLLLGRGQWRGTRCGPHAGVRA